MSRQFSLIDRFILEFDQGLTAIAGQIVPNRKNPAADYADSDLSHQEKKHSEGFIRVDHTGEVCAQALYRGQMMVSRSEQTKAMLSEACDEEKDHLAWTHERLNELGGHRSYLNIYWYLHSFFIGVVAGLCGDRWSLGFVDETERQVSAHLTHHIENLPKADIRSRKIAAQMREDEERHGHNAMQAGGEALPFAIKKLMTLQSKVMTTLAYYI
ncbi:MAG: 2-polyprenyl-3-methyl-6-methoxy-1,4-benzoquinone monooxygenase [Coxiellaceae bacterium]|nr:2-polyprenyl-3-methyl-6-methoxy-1,4-benzoquinone monooxygenase [Coxiellaceae bacterium]